jgi:MFS family permease
LVAVPPALRYPAYRAYWIGTLASVSGFQILGFGQLWLIHELTGSPLYLGYVGLANALPAIALNLFGGVFADKLDKRRLIIITQVFSFSLIFLLATLTLLKVVEVWHILTIAFVAGAVNAFDQPARQALYPHLIERKVMMSAVALNSSIWQGTRIVAPAVAGLIVAWAGTAAAFYIAGAGFLAMGFVLYRLKVPPIESSARGNAGQNIVEGLSFIRKNSIFSFLIGMTFFNSMFGMAYVILMPVFAVDVFEVGADGQGLLLSAGGMGALITTIWLGSQRTFKHKGLLLIGGATFFGLSLVAFGLTSRFIGSYPLALAILFAAGVFNSTYMVSVMSSLQMMVPDRLRGRVMGFYGMTWNIMPLGGMQAGAIASFIGAPYAVAIGGILVSAFALGPALVNSRVRNLGSLLLQFERAAQPVDQKSQPAPSAGGN